MATKKKQQEVEVEIVEMRKERAAVCLIGTSPFVCNKMSAKVIQGLLLPPKKKNSAEKQSTLKHDPYEEFRSSPYTSRNTATPTLIQAPAVSFKRAIAAAALDIGGARKSEIGRRLWVEGVDGGERIDLYGVPQIFCAVVRSADINRTPDVRTRAILPRWACTIHVNFQSPLLAYKDVSRLIGVAGQTQGVGDGRVGKGTLTYGRFEVCDPEDERFLHIVETGARASQERAMLAPATYDDETDELLRWFDIESKNRGMQANGGAHATM